MATQSYDSALDFLPDVETRKPRRLSGMIESLKTFMRAINDGLKAQHEYKVLTARGVPSADAARAAFRDHLKND